MVESLTNISTEDVRSRELLRLAKRAFDLYFHRLHRAWPDRGNRTIRRLTTWMCLRLPHNGILPIRTVKFHINCYTVDYRIKSSLRRNG